MNELWKRSLLMLVKVIVTITCQLLTTVLTSGFSHQSMLPYIKK